MAHIRILTSLLLFGLVTSACNMTEQKFELPPSIDVSISYVNEDGADLLDPDNVSYQHFNVYYLQEDPNSGDLMRVEAKRNTQYSFRFDEPSGRYAMRIFPSTDFIDGYSTTFIESPTDDFDTLKVEGRREGQGAIAETIWYNDVKVWQTAEIPPRRFFIITKSRL